MDERRRFLSFFIHTSKLKTLNHTFKFKNGCCYIIFQKVCGKETEKVMEIYMFDLVGVSVQL